MKKTNRRNFIKAAGTLGTFTVVAPSVAFGYKANSAVRMGIIGCGGRGTTVISSLSNHTNTNIIAMADLFEDRLNESKVKLDKLNLKKGFPNIAKSNTFLGSEAYLRLLENRGIDAVLISTPAYAHPDILEAALAAGKHVYCEKPIAPDVDGCRNVEQAGINFNGKLSIAIGFQIRYATPYVEMVKRIHRGDIGHIISAELHYFSSGVKLHHLNSAFFDEVRIRNHYHFRQNMWNNLNLHLDQLLIFHSHYNFLIIQSHIHNFQRVYIYPEFGVVYHRFFGK